MAGKEIGEFSTKFTSMTLSPGPAGSVLIQGNFEGTATNLGILLGTASFIGGKSGTYTFCAIAALDNGESVSGLHTGTYETIGKHRWRTQGFTDMSDGSRIFGSGEIDLATRSWIGKAFEK